MTILVSSRYLPFIQVYLLAACFDCVHHGFCVRSAENAYKLLECGASHTLRVLLQIANVLQHPTVSWGNFSGCTSQTIRFSPKTLSERHHGLLGQRRIGQAVLPSRTTNRSWDARSAQERHRASVTPRRAASTQRRGAASQPTSLSLRVDFRPRRLQPGVHSFSNERRYDTTSSVVYRMQLPAIRSLALRISSSRPDEWGCSDFPVLEQQLNRSDSHSHRPVASHSSGRSELECFGLPSLNCRYLV